MSCQASLNLQQIWGQSCIVLHQIDVYVERILRLTSGLSCMVFCVKLCLSLNFFLHLVCANMRLDIVNWDSFFAFSIFCCL